MFRSEQAANRLRGLSLKGAQRGRCAPAPEPAGETRGWAADSLFTWQVSGAEFAKVGSTRPKSRSLRRDFIAQRGHAPAGETLAAHSAD